MVNLHMLLLLLIVVEVVVEVLAHPPVLRADAAADPLAYTSEAGTSACNWTSLPRACASGVVFVCTCVVFVVVESTAAFLAQLGERTTEDRKVSCSIHEEGTHFSSPTRRTENRS